MIRTANKNARHHVLRKEVFTGSNIFSETTPGGLYVVYSYGHHFPMWVFTGQHWVGNEDSYSRTTARHKSQTAPLNIEYWLPTEKIEKLAQAGSLPAYVGMRMT